MAAFFEGLGFEVERNVTLAGARATHEIDVVVRFSVSGLSGTWIVECKHWNRPVGKDRVQVLAAVVTDVGADRGLLLAESGFQAGAFNAAKQTNVTLTSVTELTENAEEQRRQLQSETFAGAIASLARRVSRLWHWSIPRAKHPRVSKDDLLEVAGPVFGLQSMVLPRLLTGDFPIVLYVDGSRLPIDDMNDLVEHLPPLISQIDRQLEGLESQVAALLQETPRRQESFEGHLEALLDAGVELSNIAASDLGDDDVERFVSIMRALFEDATWLRDAMPPNGVRALEDIMRRLIDHTYLLVGEPRSAWEREREVLKPLTQALSQFE